MIDRRVPPQRKQAAGLLRRQPGVKSTSNLLKTVLDRPLNQGLSAEAPEARTPTLEVQLPSYLRPTTASQKKFKSTNESENLVQRGFRTTGAMPKQGHR